MTDIDRELKVIGPERQELGKILQQGMPNPSTGLYDLKSTIDRLESYLLQSNLALLSRIKEEGPEYLGNNPQLGHDAFNKSNHLWRTTIDNIAKEIRGEG